jgi:hypothetical protein
MEYTLVIYCEECTAQGRVKDKYFVFTFASLTEAHNHIQQYGHQVQIELETVTESD